MLRAVVTNEPRDEGSGGDGLAVSLTGGGAGAVCESAARPAAVGSVFDTGAFGLQATQATATKTTDRVGRTIHMAGILKIGTGQARSMIMAMPCPTPMHIVHSA